MLDSLLSKADPVASRIEDDELETEDHEADVDVALYAMKAVP